MEMSAKPEKTFGSSSFLTIPPPVRISRSGSRESFATDLSLLSLSSFTSEVSNVRLRNVLGDRDEDQYEMDPMDPVLVRYREEMLEKMLESHSLHIPHFQGGKGRHTTKTNSKIRSVSEDRSDGESPAGHCPFSRFPTRSEELLLADCKCPRRRFYLFKSFSTADVTSLHEMQSGALKSCASQAWLPSVYVQMIQTRRKHLEELKQLDLDFNEFRPQPHELTPPQPENSSPAQSSHKSRLMARANIHVTKVNKKTNETSPTTSENLMLKFASLSEENLPLLSVRKSASPFLRKLRFSREIGKRIRDDLLRKLGRQKQKLITKVDLEREKGKPVTKYERNFMIFHWLQSLDEDSFDEP